MLAQLRIQEMRLKLLLSVMMLALVSCGGSKGGGSAEKKQFPQCGEVHTLCHAEADWSINSTPVNFPKNFSIRMNNMPILDTCKDSRDVKVETNFDRKLISFRLPWVPQNEAIKFEMLDLGENCDNNAIFHSEDSVVYGVITLTVEGKKSYSVSVNLNN